jgi:thioredoxin-related protein|tara:strand:+ start:1174 stop:1665 length:492 start_codon:yes stop_codon:yes gene_type:complete
MHFTKELLFLFIFFGCFTNYAQENKGKEDLNIFTFEEVEKLQQQKPKPILIFLYTDWCKICFGMKKTTFKNREVIQLLNEKFYFIKLNAEEKKDITFLGKIFTYKPTGTTSGMHELATELGTIKKTIIYPTTILLNTIFEIDAQLTGLYNANKMIGILTTYID